MGLCGSFRQDLKADPRTMRHSELMKQAMAVCGVDIKGTRLKKEHYSQSLRKWQIFTPHRDTSDPHQQKQYAKCHQPLTPKSETSQKRAQGEFIAIIAENGQCEDWKSINIWITSSVNREKCFNPHIKADSISDKDWVSFQSVREYILQDESLKWNDIL